MQTAGPMGFTVGNTGCAGGAAMGCPAMGSTTGCAPRGGCRGCISGAMGCKADCRG